MRTAARRGDDGGSRLRHVRWGAGFGVVVVALVGVALGELAASVTATRPLESLLAAVMATVMVSAITRIVLVNPMRSTADAALGQARDRHAFMEAALARRTFDVNLSRAMEATTNEREVIALVGRAIESIAPARPGEMLLVSDDSTDVLRSATRTTSLGPAEGCPVATAAGCRAVQRGRTEVFESSQTIDACAHLRGRPCGDIGAVCAPVTVAGRNVGVVHVTSPPEAPSTPDEIVRFEELATQAAARISLLRAVEHATSQAATDPLTGAANRRALDAHARNLTQLGIEHAVVIADLDHFKLINDEHGHGIGDRTLRAFAEAMRQSLRPDDLVARIGGDEFVMLIGGCDSNQAATVIERVRRDFARQLAAARLPEATASFGVADSTAGRSLSTVLGVADDALLDAKRTGRDQIKLAANDAIDLVDDTAA